MFQFSDRHIEQYETQGYTVFRGIVPATLVEDLRRQCEIGVIQGRKEGGVNAQRFLPKMTDGIDLQPFRDFLELPAVRDAVSRVLPSEVQESTVEGMFSVLIEPGELPYCTAWHRDWRDNVKGLDLARWEADYKDFDLFNQVNCALYEDSCTWVVPGSHLRGDTDAEFQRFPTRPINGPELEGLNNAQRERACLDYCESLPGAQRLLLDAGDYCLYRNSLWHLGNYIPYRKRATLHEGVFTAKFKQWVDDNIADVSRRIAAGIEWENPNAHRLAA
jgi:ectoine hydroxylase-related dioxygenase (phytanoyl-CoA dioxygenase family)